MIEKIIQLLMVSNFYGISENIDIAKGKYKFTTSIKEQWKQAQRKRLIEKKLNNNG
jgi:Mg2+/Co2+ transporter CorB